MAETHQEEELATIVPMKWSDLMLVAAVGAVAGTVTWGIYWLLTGYLIPRFFCGDNATGICITAPYVYEGIALIIGGVIGLLGLIRLRTYRPLLIVLAVIISLGGLVQVVGVLTWYLAALASIALFALAYGLYAWVSRVRTFWIALAATVVLMIIVRLVLSS